MVTNLEIGVKNALVAYLVERGKTPAAADTAATAKLSAATDHIKASFESRRESTSVKHPDSVYWKMAFQDLKTWSASNIA